MENYLDYITVLVKQHSGCDYHRLTTVFENLGMDLNRFRGKTLNDMLEQTRLFVFNRTPGDIPLDEVLRLKKIHNFKIVTDLDDYFFLYPKHVLYNWWTKNKIDQQIINSLKISDLVIVTTERLADKIRPINKNVEVVYNGLDYDKGQFTSDKIESNKTRFIYACGSSHKWDMQLLKVPFEKVRNNPHFANCEFILAGVDHTNETSELFWNNMESAFSLAGKLKGYRSLSTLPLTEYVQHYREGDCALIPLENNTFNFYKSNLKILEAGIKYMPCIASNIPPYSDFPDKSLVQLVSTSRDWFDAIKKVATDPVFVKESGQALGEFCREHYNLSTINIKRKQIFEHLMK